MTKSTQTSKQNRNKDVRSFTLDNDIMRTIAHIAEKENRSLSNTVETALKQWADGRQKQMAL